MDPAAIFSELLKLGPFVTLMGVIVYVVNSRNKELEKKNDQLQEDKLLLTKSNAEVLNASNRHMETINETLKTFPTIIAGMQDKLVDTIRNEFRSKP